MKVFVLFSLVALCVTLPKLFSRTVKVQSNGTIILSNSEGFQIEILKSSTDPRGVEVILKSPNTRTIVFQIGKSLRPRHTNFLSVNVAQSEYNQGDILADIFRPHEGTVSDRKYYSLLNRIQSLVEAGLINETVYDIIRNWDVQYRMQGVSDIVPDQILTNLNQYDGENLQCEKQKKREFNHKWLQNYSPLKHFQPLNEKIKEQHNSNNINQAWLKNNSPLKHYQPLSKQIKKPHELQQELLGQQQYLSQKHEHSKHFKLNTNQMDRQKLVQIPLKHFLITRKLLNEQKTFGVPEEFIDLQILEQVFDKQKRVNKKWTKIIERKQPITRHTLHQQQHINEQVEKLIEQIGYHQNLITSQVKQHIDKEPTVPQQIFDRQRLLYHQIHELMERLHYQQLFITRKVQRITELDTAFNQKLIVQQRSIYQQIQTLIQQIFLQQTHLNEKVQLLIQEGQVISEGLLDFQKMTYQYVEKFLHVLIKQLVHQQACFRHAIQFYVRQGSIIPQEMISQYFMIYDELLQVIQQGDVVPKDLIYEQELIHQQIVLSLQQINSVPQKLLTKTAPLERQIDLLVDRDGIL
uniref:Uncharacterized protein LOC114328791 n=1 Tax=Diabrotica virgifera virgifera TaxID=50390 RepID=A0A6P7FK53_DIAVI